MNQLFVHTRIYQQMQPIVEEPAMEETDRRYRILILLQRSDKPIHWTFHCPRCQKDLFEVTNAELQAVSDLVSTEMLDNVTIGYRCSGAFCKYWYYVKLNGAGA